MRYCKKCTMPDTLLDSRWSCWTRKDKNGDTVDVTCHADVRFAEVNSRTVSFTQGFDFEVIFSIDLLQFCEPALSRLIIGYSNI